MINYEKRTNNYSSIEKFDSTKNNILILGKADNHKERCNVINPRGTVNARELYGVESDLYKAYVQCYFITNEYNIYTANCRTYNDFLVVMDLVLHYNFTFIVPIGLKMDDTFYNEKTNTYEYYIDYFMYLIEEYQCITTIIMTGNHAKDYDNIDDFLEYNNNVLNSYYKHTMNDSDNYAIYKNNGSDLIYILNNLENVAYANVILAGQLIINDFTKYPRNIDYLTYYDIDHSDTKGKSYAYHQINHLTGDTSIENLVNMRLYEDVYKNALIDLMIKTVLRKLDLDQYRGRLYNAYIKLQIKKQAVALLNTMKNVYFKNYEIKSIGFVKTESTAGYIYIELSIMPYGFMEYIDVVLEV